MDKSTLLVIILLIILIAISVLTIIGYLSNNLDTGMAYNATDKWCNFLYRK